MNSLLPPPKYIAFTESFPDGREEVSNPWYEWASNIARNLAGGPTITVSLAKITGGGADGSLTIINGIITAVTQPT